VAHPRHLVAYAGAADAVGVTFDVVDGKVVARDASSASTRLCWDVDDLEHDPCRAR
jgi:hypothetical protein